MARNLNIWLQIKIKTINISFKNVFPSKFSQNLYRLNEINKLRLIKNKKNTNQFNPFDKNSIFSSFSNELITVHTQNQFSVSFNVL